MWLLTPLGIAAFYLYFGYVPLIIWVIGIIIVIAVVFRLITGETNGPVVVLNDEGVFDKRLRVGVIRWEDIRRIRLHDLSGAMYVSLELHNPSTYEARRPLWLKLLSQVQRVHGMSPTSISVNGLQIHHEDLAGMIHEGCEMVSERNAEIA